MKRRKMNCTKFSKREEMWSTAPAAFALAFRAGDYKTAKLLLMSGHVLDDVEDEEGSLTLKGLFSNIFEPTGRAMRLRIFKRLLKKHDLHPFWPPYWGFESDDEILSFIIEDNAVDLLRLLMSEYRYATSSDEIRKLRWALLPFAEMNDSLDMYYATRDALMCEYACESKVDGELKRRAIDAKKREEAKEKELCEMRFKYEKRKRNLAEEERREKEEVEKKYKR